MQILFEFGDEHGVVTKGLGLLPGGVTRLAAQRVPHMGWNTVDSSPSSVLFAGIPADARFYFVHSYAAHPSPALDSLLVGTTVHDGPFVAAVESGPLMATQFHPEKSGDAGADLLANWLRTLS
jgi:imidazole glycerol-phosphate synthase subunit HisH